MKRNTILASLFAAASLLPCVAPAQSFQSFYKAILPRIVRAMETGDVKFFDAISTPDFTEKGPEGVRNKGQAMTQMAKQFSTIQKLTCRVRPISVKAVGRTGTVLLWMKADMIPGGQEGKRHTFSIETTETESWVKTGSIWKVRSMIQSGRSKMKMDGKPYDPSKAANGH